MWKHCLYFALITLFSDKRIVITGLSDTLGPSRFSSRGMAQESLCFPRIENGGPSTKVSFEAICREAIERNLPLFLSQDVCMVDTIRLRREERLEIHGPSDTTVTIQGDLHSLFVLNNKSKISIENVNLDHTRESEDHTEVGAAVNLRKKGSASLKNCKITSSSGFCVWAVQKCRLAMNDCLMVCPSRSAVVCFGQAQCQLENCDIDRAGVHGLCARGACQITLTGCRITNSIARGLYAYANASVSLDGCHISGTLHPERAAVEMSSMGCPNTEIVSSLVLKNCEIIDNHGVGIRLCGPISYKEEGTNHYERNDKGDWDIVEDLDDESKRTNVETLDLSQINADGIPRLQRNPKGSSFRRGDWLCSKCLQIMAGRPKVDEQCNHCSCVRSPVDRLLTMDEIRKCNMGIDFRKEIASSNTEIATAVWEFDGGDEKGWIAYDEESSNLLEVAFSRLPDEKNSSLPQTISRRIFLSGGVYEVNLETMEQINMETKFLRFVRRRKHPVLSA